MAKRKRSRRRRRGLRGLRQARLMKRGMVRDLVPPVVGLGLTAGTTLGIRAYLQPTPGTASETLYKFAPAVGVGAGVLGGLAMAVLGGKSQAASAVTAAALTGAVLYGMERLHASKPGAFAALVGSAPTGTAGLRAIVPEYSGGPFATRGLRGATPGGLGAIVMERLNGNQQNQGADIQLRGTVNTGAFGTRPYQS